MDCMEFISCNDERVCGADDAQTIQNAIDLASREGLDQVLIPRRNRRTGEAVWHIGRSIVLPSSMTVIVSGAYLRAADDLPVHVFCTEPQQEELHDIRILGVGEAVIDGGRWTREKRPEYYHEQAPDKYPDGCDYDLISLFNVRNFEVAGLCITNAKHYSTCFTFCRFGRIHDLHFRNYATVENQDGIDLRYGCEFITIENITGVTGDDTVALNAIDELETNRLRVAGKTIDIHDVTIRNIIASTHASSLVRLLNTDGAKLYNITIENVKDTGKTISICAVFFGTPAPVWARRRMHTEDEFYNITIRDVTTCAAFGIRFAESCRDVLVENLHTYGSCVVPIQFSRPFTCQNFTLRDVYLRSEAPLKAAIAVSCEPEKLRNFRMERVYVENADYIFAVQELPVADLTYEPPHKGWLTAEFEKTQLPYYGRYFKHSLGKVIEHRTPDNRFGGTTPPEADF